jgi:predicted RNA binding protein YcfA (HicA-like mRNA interferase family)
LKPRKLFPRLTANQANVRFAEFVKLVEAFGFVLDRHSGSSHRIYKHRLHADARLNLQPVGGEAKPYQIRQFLKLVEEYNLAFDEGQ